MMGNFGQANYAAAKAGIYGLTRTTSIELQKHRITVNALAPIAKTRMTEDLPMFQSGIDTMTPDHIAPAALFLGVRSLRRQDGPRARRRRARRCTPSRSSRAPGSSRTGHGVWTAQEIAEHWDAIVKV